MVDTARKDRLAYTRSRIGQLYGPLCGLLGVEASVWVAINDEEDREPNLERFMTRVDTSIVPLMSGLGHQQTGSIRAFLVCFF